ncbi:MAG: helix-hairpin-helix domain-containing protein, partial [Bacteroidales bacterium]|nr:helix-hairpin-helix domain-containing protein [Bacteroidales bacterium]
IDLPDKNNKNNSEYNVKKNTSGQKININYFNFDPNILDDSGWKELGFSEKQIASIRKYINNGGKFYKKEDLKKLYVINDKKYAELEPYINIPEKEKNFEKNISEKHQAVDINNLSAEEMKKYGKFWQYNATRIVKYRNLLGGYYKKEQLLEVYGVKKEYYDKIAEDIVIDKSKLEKININFAEVSELGKHPYISYQDAKKIIEYRNKNGFINNLNILKTKNIIPSDLFDKISPYLKVK